MDDLCYCRSVNAGQGRSLQAASSHPGARAQCCTLVLRETPTPLHLKTESFKKTKANSFQHRRGRHAERHQTPTRVDNGQCAHPVVFSTGCSKLNVVPTVVVDTGLGQHGIILNLRFPGESKEKKTAHVQLLTEVNGFPCEFTFHQCRVSEVGNTDQYSRE